MPCQEDRVTFGDYEALARDGKLLCVGVTRAKAGLVLSFAGAHSALLPRIVHSLHCGRGTVTIEEDAKSRGITRLCHFTESRNLAYMHAGFEAILPTAALIKTYRALFNPTDRQRFDGHVDKISCSIEYPNVWYFEKARANQPIFPDWVVLLIVN